MLKGSQITPNMLDRAKILAKRYYDDKGYKNAEITITQKDDVSNKNQVILDFDVDKKEKITSKTYRGKIEDESLMGLIVGTIVDSPHVNKQQLKEFGIVKD